ncbi:GFA family protein [Tepidicaulis sp. LMO-SS28]|uniref:GFA family protein n=1 Tax=Tepidicaulis sp. LMO-SS28 TaxID=3447455 RepID=UPI003EE351DF
MKKTYRGSCHCGAVTYEAGLDLSQGSIRCNCSICNKSRSWLALVPEAEVRLLSGEDQLTSYRFGQHRIHHLFCKTCGVKPFGRGSVEDGGAVMYALNLTCLDDASPAELAAVPIQFVDGKNENWTEPPSETSYL